MNFQGSFKKIGDIDVHHLKNVVERLTDHHWNFNDMRQRRYDVHKDTQTIHLVFDEDFRHTNPTRHEPLEIFAPLLNPILAKIADYYEKQQHYKPYLEKFGPGYFIRANLIKLKPGGSIEEHQDKNFSLAHSHRIHIPIKTSEQVLFRVGNQEINMKEGEVIEINNRKFHAVTNLGEQDRVHLILDWVIPGEPCCCAAKTHPGETCNPELCMETDRLLVPCVCHGDLAN